jgi:hypothetical protein
MTSDKEINSSSEGQGSYCLACGGRATYEREMVERCRLYGLDRHGQRERLIHGYTPRVSIEFVCDLHAGPLEKGAGDGYQ